MLGPGFRQRKGPALVILTVADNEELLAWGTSTETEMPRTWDPACEGMFQ